MQSEYVLLCSPYRYSSVFTYPVNKTLIERELLGVVMSGTNILARNMLCTMLEKNYGITDYLSLKEQIEALEKGTYHAIKDVDYFIHEMFEPATKELLLSLQALTHSRNLQGFDDCRIIDVLTKAFAANLITQKEFDELFSKQTERIKNSYHSWEQYLASCVLGKLLQFIPSSKTIVSVEEYVLDIYAFCIAPSNVFSYGTFWPNHKLEHLTAWLEKLLPKEKVLSLKSSQNPTKDKIPGFNTPSNDLLYHFEENGLDANLIDEKRYAYLCELAKDVLWQPLVNHHLEWLITEKNLKEQDVLLLPTEFASLYSAREFWSYYAKYTELHQENIFAMFEATFGLNVLFTEEAAYTFKKKLFGKPTLVRIPWNEVSFSYSLDLDLESKICFDKKPIIDVFPAISDIGLNEKILSSLSDQERTNLENEWKQKMQAFLEGIPQRIRAFKEKKK